MFDHQLHSNGSYWMEHCSKTVQIGNSLQNPKHGKSRIQILENHTHCGVHIRSMLLICKASDCLIFFCLFEKSIKLLNLLWKIQIILRIPFQGFFPILCYVIYFVFHLNYFYVFCFVFAFFDFVNPLSLSPRCVCNSSA